MTNYQNLPSDLPIPVDDGACDHLTGLKAPDIALNSTSNELINLSNFDKPTVLYFYPRTSNPGVILPDNWDAIPGARGCTPQSCAFRDHQQELTELGAQVYGVSTQSTAYQQETKSNLHLLFDILSDEALALKNVMNLPTFEVQGMELFKRFTLILDHNVIEKVFYPVFPTSEDPVNIINWLKQR